MPTIHAFDYLEKPVDEGSLTVLAGDDGFLAGLVLEKMRDRLGSPTASFDSKSAKWFEINDQLASASLFDDTPPLIVVSPAEEFVTNHRADLEKRATQKTPSGKLVLVVNSFPGNTRLAKMVDKDHVAITCSVPVSGRGKNPSPDVGRVASWLSKRGRVIHQIAVDDAAARALVDLHGSDLGLLEQQMAKLALMGKAGEKFTPERVAALTGSWRTQTVWDMMDAVAEGRASDALRPLGLALDAKESPQGLFAQMAFVLRRIGNSVRIFEDAERNGRKLALRDALIAAGVPHWNRAQLDSAESQLRRLGRDKARQFAVKTLEADLALKGSHSRDERARLVLERLLIELAADR